MGKNMGAKHGLTVQNVATLYYSIVDLAASLFLYCIHIYIYIYKMPWYKWSNSVKLNMV